jgi:hypothetical protein
MNRRARLRDFRSYAMLYRFSTLNYFGNVLPLALNARSHTFLRLSWVTRSRSSCKDLFGRPTTSYHAVLAHFEPGP